MSSCPNDLVVIPDDAKFCPRCGSPVPGEGSPQCQDDGPSAPTVKASYYEGPDFEEGLPEAPPAGKPGGTARGEAGTDGPGGLTPRHSMVLAATAMVGLLIVLLYHYLGFVVPVQEKQMGATARQQSGAGQGATAQVQRSPEPGEQSTSPADAGRPNPAGPSAAEIEAAKAQLAGDANNATLNTHVGNLLFDAGRFDEAIPYYQRSLEIAPNNPDVLVDLGVCYFNLEQFERAREYFQLALNVDAAHVNALYNMGVVAVQLGEVNNLIQHWTRLQEVAPQSPQAQRAAQILESIHQNIDQFSGENSQ